jgi:hypothetical protein
MPPKSKRPAPKPKWSRTGAAAEFLRELYRTIAVTLEMTPQKVSISDDLANFRMNLHHIREEVELDMVTEMDGKFMINSVLC